MLQHTEHHTDIIMIESSYSSRVSCQKSPTHHAYAWQIGPFLAGYPRHVMCYPMPNLWAYMVAFHVRSMFFKMIKNVERDTAIHLTKSHHEQEL